jgi:arylsulfatase
MIWEGKKGQPSTPVMPLDLHVRPIVDEKYIVPKTIDFIERNAAAKKPFFVYVGYSEMHPPAMANPGFSKAGDPYGKYSDLVREMDFRVGQILDAIKEAGADNNTIVVLTSDNGAGLAEGGGVITQPQGGSSGPWRGNFFTPGFEGSYRTCGMIRWPGHIPSGMVTEEILSAHDWLPTLAGFVGASQLVPTDRPIDGRDASDFLLGKSPTTGSDSYLFFGPDGGPMSVKWKTYKILFRYCEDIEKPLVTPQLPMIYDLSSDPHEDWNIIKTRLDTDWLLTPAMKVLMAFEASVKKYPNIKPGEDFKGY